MFTESSQGGNSLQKKHKKCTKKRERRFFCWTSVGRWEINCFYIKAEYAGNISKYNGGGKEYADQKNKSCSQ